MHCPDLPRTPLPARNVTPNFRWDEFTVSNSHPELVKPVPQNLLGNVAALADLLEVERTENGDRPIRILSGYRPIALNYAIGGSYTSQHLVAQAVDWAFYGGGQGGVYPAFVKMLTRERPPEVGQVIYYPDDGFIHLALPNLKWVSPSFHVHQPRRKLIYKPVRDEAQLRSLLG